MLAVTLRDLTRQVAKKHKITPTSLLSPWRARSHAIARQELYYRALSETTLSTPNIGRALARDPTTVAYGARKHAERNGLPFDEMWPSKKPKDRT